MLNEAQLIGRLGKDPEVRHLSSGDRVVTFSLATSERWKDKNGERQERTEWHNVVIYNEHLGKVAEQFLHKGSQAFIRGKIQTRKYEKDGTDRYVTEIVLQKFAGELKLLDKKSDDERPGSVQSGDDYARAKSGVKSAAKPKTRYDDLDDEIPF